MISRKEFESLGKELKCPICWELWADPTLTSCGHVFCNECLKKSMKPHDSTCPVCKNPIFRRSLDKFQIFNNLVDSYRKLEEKLAEREAGAPMPTEDTQADADLIGSELRCSPLFNLSQLYPYPQKENSESNMEGPAAESTAAVTTTTATTTRRTRGSGASVTTTTSRRGAKQTQTSNRNRATPPPAVSAKSQTRKRGRSKSQREESSQEAEKGVDLEENETSHREAITTPTSPFGEKDRKSESKPSPIGQRKNRFSTSTNIDPAFRGENEKQQKSGFDSNLAVLVSPVVVASKRGNEKGSVEIGEDEQGDESDDVTLELARIEEEMERKLAELKVIESVLSRSDGGAALLLGEAEPGSISTDDFVHHRPFLPLTPSPTTRPPMFMLGGSLGTPQGTGLDASLWSPTIPSSNPGSSPDRLSKSGSTPVATPPFPSNVGHEVELSPSGRKRHRSPSHEPQTCTSALDLSAFITTPHSNDNDEITFFSLRSPALLGIEKVPASQPESVISRSTPTSAAAVLTAKSAVGGGSGSGSGEPQAKRRSVVQQTPTAAIFGTPAPGSGNTTADRGNSKLISENEKTPKPLFPAGILQQTSTPITFEGAGRTSPEMASDGSSDQQKTPMAQRSTPRTPPCRSSPTKSTSLSMVSPTAPQFSSCARVHIACTAVVASNQKEVLESAKKLGATIVDDVTTHPTQVTHMLTSVDSSGLAKRTIKYAMAIAVGAWVLSFEWLEKSVEAGRWLYEEPFEVIGDTQKQMGAPKRSRLAVANKEAKILDDVRLHFHSSIPDQLSSELKMLSQLMGATVMAHKKLSTPTFIIVSKECSQSVRDKINRDHHKYPVNHTWILDCLCRQQLLGVADYHSPSPPSPTL